MRHAGGAKPIPQVPAGGIPPAIFGSNPARPKRRTRAYLGVAGGGERKPASVSDRGGPCVNDSLPRVRPTGDNSWGPDGVVRIIGVPRGRIISKESLFVDVESYVSKVTTAGQLTLPKKIREALGLGGQDYVEVALVGRTAVIRRLREDDEFLEAISKKVKKTGLTRARMQELLDEVKRDAWKKRYREAVR